MQHQKFFSVKFALHKKLHKVISLPKTNSEGFLYMLFPLQEHLLKKLSVSTGS